MHNYRAFDITNNLFYHIKKYELKCLNAKMIIKQQNNCKKRKRSYILVFFLLISKLKSMSRALKKSWIDWPFCERTKFIRFMTMNGCRVNITLSEDNQSNISVKINSTRFGALKSFQ